MKTRKILLPVCLVPAAVAVLAVFLFNQGNPQPEPSVSPQATAVVTPTVDVPATEPPDTTVQILDEVYDDKTVSIDLSRYSYTQIMSAIPDINMLPELQTVYLAENGSDRFTVDEICGIIDALPDVFIDFSVDFYGQIIGSNDETVVYDNVEMDNSAVEILKRLLANMKCTYFQLSDCKIDYSELDVLKQMFPERNIVWRVYIYSTPYMTDCERVRTVHIDDTTSQVLKYCTEVKYVDFGHNEYLSTCEFLRYMPHLKSAILGLTSITDISPLENCTELELLEIGRSDVQDISVLSDLKQLKYLNIAQMPLLNSITPLYELTGLEVVRLVETPSVPKEQLNEIQQKLPDTLFLTEGWDLYENGWRYDENGTMTPWYAELRKQMGYDEDK